MFKGKWKGVLMFSLLICIIILIVIIHSGIAVEKGKLGGNPVIIDGKDFYKKDDKLRVLSSNPTRDGGILLIVTLIPNFDEAERNVEIHIILYDTPRRVIWRKRIEIKGEEEMFDFAELDIEFSSLENGNHFIIVGSCSSYYADYPLKEKVKDTRIWLFKIDKKNSEINLERNYFVKGFIISDIEIAAFKEDWIIVTSPGFEYGASSPIDYHIVNKKGETLFNINRLDECERLYKISIFIGKLRVKDFEWEWNKLYKSKGDYISFFSEPPFFVDTVSWEIFVYGFLVVSELDVMIDYDDLLLENQEHSYYYDINHRQIISVDKPDPIHFHISELDSESGDVLETVIFPYHGDGYLNLTYTLCVFEIFDELNSRRRTRIKIIPSSETRPNLYGINSRNDQIFKINLNSLGNSIEWCKEITLVDERFQNFEPSIPGERNQFYEIKEISSTQDGGVIVFFYIYGYIVGELEDMEWSDIGFVKLTSDDGDLEFQKSLKEMIGIDESSDLSMGFDVSVISNSDDHLLFTILLDESIVVHLIDGTLDEADRVFPIFDSKLSNCKLKNALEGDLENLDLKTEDFRVEKITSDQFFDVFFS